MPSNLDWNDYLSKATPPRKPQGNFLQGTVRTPSFNEREEQHHKFTKEWGGEDACQKAYFEERYAPGGSTIPRGETEK